MSLKLTIVYISTSQVGSIDTVLAYGAGDCKFEFYLLPVLSWKLNMLEIHLDKKLIANCLVEHLYRT